MMPMRAVFPLLLLSAVLVAPAASATTVVTKQCTLATDAAISQGSCNVAAFANEGVRVLITVWADTVGNAHVTMQNSAGGAIVWDCRLDGTAHACDRIVDTGGPNAGVWTVSGSYLGANPFFTAGATMRVDFLTF